MQWEHNDLCNYCSEMRNAATQYGFRSVIVTQISFSEKIDALVFGCIHKNWNSRTMTIISMGIPNWKLNTELGILVHNFSRHQIHGRKVRDSTSSIATVEIVTCRAAMGLIQCSWHLRRYFHTPRHQLSSLLDDKQPHHWNGDFPCKIRHPILLSHGHPICAFTQCVKCILMNEDELDGKRHLIVHHEDGSSYMQLC